MSIFAKLFGRPKVDKLHLVRTLVIKRINESFSINILRAQLDVYQMSNLQLLSLPEAGIITIVETYIFQKNKGMSDSNIFTMIERHRSKLYSGGGLPKPLNIESFIKYRMAIETQGPFPLEEKFIDFAVMLALSAYSGGLSKDVEGTETVFRMAAEHGSTYAQSRVSG